MRVEDIQICNFEDIDLKGATVIAGFPSIGLVSTIAANYLIDALNLKQIGCVTSSQFPALSVVHTGEPLSPVRIYAGSQGPNNKIVVFVQFEYIFQFSIWIERIIWEIIYRKSNLVRRIFRVKAYDLP